MKPKHAFLAALCGFTITSAFGQSPFKFNGTIGPTAIQYLKK